MNPWARPTLRGKNPRAPRARLVRFSVQLGSRVGHRPAGARLRWCSVHSFGCLHQQRLATRNACLVARITRKHMSGNGFHFRFQGARPAEEDCVPWARPNQINSQPTHRLLASHGQAEGNISNQTWPRVHATHTKKNHCSCWLVAMASLGVFGRALEPNSRPELAGASQTTPTPKKVGAAQLHGVLGALVHSLVAPLFQLHNPLKET